MADEKEIVTVENNFPSNSNGDNIPKEEKKETPVLKKFSQEDRVTKKKTFLSNFLEASGDAFRFALDEIIVPNIKKIAVDAGNSLMYRAIYREDAPPPSRRRGYYDDWDYPVTRYDSYYSRPKTYSYDDRRYDTQRYSRNRNDLPPIIFRVESTARDFLDELHSALEKYHEITVNNVYDSYGNPDYLREIDYTWNGYGWTDEPNRDLRGSTVSRVKDGYLVVLPKPVPLER